MKPENGYSFNSQEEEALKQFLTRCPSISSSSAVKFLCARKFNVERAVELLRNHETVRHREGLTNFQPTLSPLREELETAKFTVLPWRDSQGAAITMFTASKHSPSTSSHRTTLQGVVYQLDVALENPLTQRDGIVFVYNMSASRYEHFDYELCQKILQLLKGAYPARLKKVLIVSAPLWFRAPFKILRLFVREKLRDRVMIVSQAQLVAHIPPSSLPIELGGTQTDHDHHAWLLHCLKVHNQNFVNQSGLDDHLATEKLIEIDDPSDDICSRNSERGNQRTNGNGTALQQQQTPDANGAQNGNNGVTPEREEVAEEEGDDNSLVSGNSIHVGQLPPPVPPIQFQPASNGPVSGVPHVHHVPTEIVAPPIARAQTPPELEPPKDMSMEEFILDLQRKGRRGLCREYQEIKSRPPTGTFESARDKMNQSKNRYTDVLCLDHSRVKLSVSSDNVEEDGATDYINANYVDGYKMKKAFISTQGPLPRTFGDFWKMIWEEKCGVIVMTTRCVERTRTKCGQYWPAAEGEEHEHGEFRIANQGVEAAGDYQVTELQVCLRDNEDELSARTIWHLQFLSWPDYGVPESAFAMLSFRDVCLQKQRDTLNELQDRQLWDSPQHGPPIVVHCSAGIGRTGTFITLDTCIRRLEAENIINVRETVESIRSQRAFSIQMPDQYVFCHLALLEYALIHGHLKDVDLSGFDDSSEESPDDH